MKEAYAHFLTLTVRLTNVIYIMIIVENITIKAMVIMNILVTKWMNGKNLVVRGHTLITLARFYSF